MCGILFCATQSKETSKEQFSNLLQLLHHRGPDNQSTWSHSTQTENVYVGHTRLAIVGVEDGTQPIVSTCGNYVLSVNGEIYNYETLWSELSEKGYTRNLKTDCEVILPLYQEYGSECVKHLDGIFSFVLYDKQKNSILIARDRIGVLPCYVGFNSSEFWVSSECKCLLSSQTIEVLPPGHSMYATLNTLLQKESNIKSLCKNYDQDAFWRSSTFVSDKRFLPQILEETKDVLIRAVEKRLMADVPFGVLLSGGLDSSLVASIANRIQTQKGYGPIHTFSIGLPGSPDLIAAKKVADFLGTHHHEYTFSVEEGLSHLKKLVWHLETYDITTIRASLPMYLLSKHIHEDGFKMVLSGEGADEILGGYLYFHNAPYLYDFHEECKRRITELHHFDCLRANKSTMAWNIEARVPFLDKDVLDSFVKISPTWKRGSDNRVKNYKCMEKWVLRCAFDDENLPFLPQEVLWRQKEQFSDGVGYSWIDGLKEYTKNHESVQSFPENQREKEFYKNLFYSQFPRKETQTPIEIKTWVPRTDWKGVHEDPSGRAQLTHVASYGTSSENTDL